MIHTQEEKVQKLPVDKKIATEVCIQFKRVKVATELVQMQKDGFKSILKCIFECHHFTGS